MPPDRGGSAAHQCRPGASARGVIFRFATALATLQTGGGGGRLAGEGDGRASAAQSRTFESDLAVLGLSIREGRNQEVADSIRDRALNSEREVRFDAAMLARLKKMADAEDCTIGELVARLALEALHNRDKRHVGKFSDVDGRQPRPRPAARSLLQD
jgi:hypothetical protein